ncbi:MAG: hypothetical protein WCD37_18040 [Chloroflexia bacterium]
MDMRFLEHQLEIGVLHARGASQDGPMLRLALERLLGSADLSPPGMPPQAVLVVRRMNDPQPGRIADGRGASRVRDEWERRAREGLADLYRRAARPALGGVPESAEAVVFADESELLACLMLDVCRGLARQHWWWRAVLRSVWRTRESLSQEETASALARYMSRRAYLVPAALARLNERNLAPEAILALSTAQAEEVLRAVLEAYRLLELPVDSVNSDQRVPDSWKADQAVDYLSLGLDLGLGRERAALLGLALDLHDRPQQVRTPGYRRQLRAWWRATQSNAPIEKPKAQDDHWGVSASPRETDYPSNQNVQPSDPETVPEGQRQPRSISSETTQSELGATARFHTSRSQGAGNPPTRTQTPNLTDGAPPPEMQQTELIDDPGIVVAGRASDFSLQSREADREAFSPTMQDEGYPPDIDRSPWPSAAEERDRQIAAWLAGGVSTQLGGVLYLVNLMVSLDLPDCFEDGWHLASRVGAWGLLEALGRELMSCEMAGLENDPLWAALAELDGRAPDQPPGFLLSRGRPRRWPRFRLPDAWLAGLPGGEEYAREDKLRPRQKLTNTHYPPLLKRWLVLALPFIKYRLHLALGLQREASLAEHLLKLPGWLYVTSSHVDLAASVESLSLPIRLAGLDRDPGWLPNFGRVMYFHYE